MTDKKSELIAEGETIVIFSIRHKIHFDKYPTKNTTDNHIYLKPFEVHVRAQIFRKNIWKFIIII